MRHGPRQALALGIVALALGIAASAFAQAVDDGYSAKGLPLGGFRLFPTFHAGWDYDDNVYRANSNTEHDSYYTLTPEFRLLSQWGRHELDIFGSLAAFEYSSLHHETHIDGIIGGNGRLDVYRGIDVIGGGTYEVHHEQRISPDQPGFAKKPTRYELDRANAAFEYRPYQFHFTLGGNLVHYNYFDTIIIAGPPLNNNDRDRDEYNYFAKGAYEFSPGYAAFVQLGGRDVHYDMKYDRSGLQRDNQGYNVNAGMDMAVTRLIEGEVYVGYLNETYKNPLPNITGLNYNVNLDWYVDPLWTLHLTGSRLLNGTTINGASAEDDQSIRLLADFKPQPNLAFQGYVEYLDENFDGISRDDRYTMLGLKVKYLMNHNMFAEAGYDYENRGSTVTGQNFNDNHVYAALNFQL
jgi:hypothetical protein